MNIDLAFDIYLGALVTIAVVTTLGIVFMFDQDNIQNDSEKE